jgi:CO dehydrogenase nickel-insertion accessory protein CooC1
LQELKTTKQYERIFIDFSCAINKNNLAVLRNCDDLLLVAEENQTSVVKIKCMLKELHLLLSREEEAELMERFNLVLNKSIPTAEVKTEELSINQKGVLARIPLVEDLTILQDGVCKLDLNSSFGKALYQLLLNF